MKQVGKDSSPPLFVKTSNLQYPLDMIHPCQPNLQVKVLSHLSQPCLQVNSILCCLSQPSLEANVPSCPPSQPSLQVNVPSPLCKIIHHISSNQSLEVTVMLIHTCLHHQNLKTKPPNTIMKIPTHCF